MFKVIVVDDEPLVRMALQEIIDWESFGCELVAEFANGKEALAYVRKHPVELAVIDVDMPVMNGLDFLQTLSEEDGMRRPHAVMLSAYSDYDFVRKAFLLGAIDYIVKDDLEENYVAGVIRNALRTIEERTAARQKESREREKRTKEIRRERLPELLQHEPLDGEGHDEESDPDFKHWLQESARSQQVLIDILIDRSAFDPPVSVDAKKSRYIMRAVEQVLVSGTKEAYLVNWHSYHYTAVLFLQPDASLQNLRKRLSGLVQKMMNHLKQYINVSASFGISDPCRGFEHWHACYEQARRLSRLRFYYGIGRAVFSGTTAGKKRGTRLSLEYEAAAALPRHGG